MRHTLTLFGSIGLLLFAVACSSSDLEPMAGPTPAAAVEAAASEAPAPERCTFETPLEPGIPGSPGHLIPSDRNPNGLSELAQLMRVMNDDMVALRERVLAGEPVGPLPEHHYGMRCAWPTDQKARNRAYDGMAVHYLGRLEAMHAPGADPQASYEALVDACVTCHQARCPGPVAAILELRLPAPSPR